MVRAPAIARVRKHSVEEGLRRLIFLACFIYGYDVTCFIEVVCVGLIHIFDIVSDA